MSTRTTLGLSAALLIAFPISAAAVDVGETLGTDEAAIRASIEAAGYEITDIDRDDDEIEVEAKRGDQEFEITIDREAGLVTEIELED